MNVQLLLTGNELMSGDIIDTNSVMIAQQLKEIGVEIKRKVTLADDLHLLINEIINISKNADILIINGGLGPTTDDLTAEALAKASQQNIVQHPKALEHLTLWCQKRNYVLNQPNLKQAMLPANADIIANTVGSAVGFTVKLNNCQIYCTPGVPSELRVMLNEQIIPIIKPQLPAQLQAHTTRLQVFGYGESTLQKVLLEYFPDFPSTLEIGYRASMPLLELKITSRTTADLPLKELWLEKFKMFFGAHIVHQVINEPITLARQVLNLLMAKNKTITTAESCTGGLIASLLTREYGASNAFHAGFITYSNNIKEQIINVNSETLTQYGAVSEEVAKEMALGALNKSQANFAIAVSGIAGPTGGTAEKPVGTVCIAWGNHVDLSSKTFLISGNRFYFQQYVAAISLDLLRRKLLNCKDIPQYVKEKGV